MHETGVLTTLGKGIYQQIVVPNPNVRLVVCGHHHAAGVRPPSWTTTGTASPTGPFTRCWRIIRTRAREAAALCAC